MLRAGGGELVSSQCAVSGNRFGDPHPGIVPRFDVPDGHIDSGRFCIDEVRAGYPVAEELLGPWLTRFRDDDLFELLRERR